MARRTVTIDNVFFSEMPNFGQVMYEQGIALYDTLEGFRRGGDAETEFVDCPVRAQLVMFILCVSGRIRMRLNLQDYEMGDGDVMWQGVCTPWNTSVRFSRRAPKASPMA